MRNRVLVLSVLMACIAAPSLAGAAGPAVAGALVAGAKLSVEEFMFCAAIKDRSPAGVADTFPSDIYGVYCYTKVAGAKDTTAITHVWYYGDAKSTATRLPVRSSPWRTWSVREMRDEWKGTWRVDVLGPDGSVIASKKFFMK